MKLTAQLDHTVLGRLNVTADRLVLSQAAVIRLALARAAGVSNEEAARVNAAMEAKHAKRRAQALKEGARSENPNPRKHYRLGEEPPLRTISVRVPSTWVTKLRRVSARLKPGDRRVHVARALEAGMAAHGW